MCVVLAYNKQLANANFKNKMSISKINNKSKLPSNYAHTNIIYFLTQTQSEKKLTEE